MGCHWLIPGHVALTKIKCIPIVIHHAMYPARDTLQHVIKAWCKVASLKAGILTFREIVEERTE